MSYILNYPNSYKQFFKLTIAEVDKNLVIGTKDYLQLK